MQSSDADHGGQPDVTQPMTYDEAFAHLTTTFGMSSLTARNVLLDAFKGQNAWFGGSTSPYRVVHSVVHGRTDGYQVLADGYVPAMGA
jgi:hypothetical protein